MKNCVICNVCEHKRNVSKNIYCDNIQEYLDIINVDADEIDTLAPKQCPLRQEEWVEINKNHKISEDVSRLFNKYCYSDDIHKFIKKVYKKYGYRQDLPTIILHALEIDQDMYEHAFLCEAIKSYIHDKAK